MTTIDEMSYKDEIKAILAWLESKHCTLWSTFDVVQKDTKLKAAEWFHDEVKSLMDFMEEWKNDQ